MLVNKKQYSLEEETTLEQFISQIMSNEEFAKFKPYKLSIFLNGNLVKEEEYDKVILVDEDKINLVPRMAGG